jgi:Cytochrome c oxidase subunit IIa family
VADGTRPGDDDVARGELDAVIDEVPKGALALAGIAILLLLAGWFFVYFAIFIPRGSVG